MHHTASIVPAQTAAKAGIDIRAILRLVQGDDDVIDFGPVAPVEPTFSSRARCLHAMSDAVRARHHVTTVTSLSVPENFEQGVLIVRAPMGSGKTQRILAPIAAGSSEVVALTPRVSLASELSQRLELTNYRAGRPENVERGVCLCVPSIANQTWGAYVEEHGSVLLMDEIEQILRFLTAPECSTSIEGPDGVYLKLRQMIRRAKIIVAADAHISDLTIEFIEECRPAGERFQIVEMPAQETDICVDFLSGRHSINRGIARILGEIELGNKVWIATDSVTQADLMHASITARFSAHKRVLLVKQKTKESHEQRTFLDAADHRSRAYDVVIASPVISSGLSIEHPDAEEHERFDLVAYIGGSGLTVCPTDALQMMRRVRYARRILVAVEQSNLSRAPVDAKGYIEGKVACERLEGRDTAVNVYHRFVARVRSLESEARLNFTTGLLDLMREERWNVRLISRSEDESGDDAEDLTGLRDEIRAQHVHDLIEAPVLSSEQVELMRGGRVQLDPAQHAALEAWDVRRDLALPPETRLTERLIKEWDSGRCKRKVELFIALRREEDSVKPEDLDVDMTHRKHILAASRLLGEVLEGINLAAPIDPFTAAVILRRAWRKRFAMAVAGLVDASWSSTRPDAALPPAKIHLRVLGEIFRRCGLVLRKTGQVYVRDIAETPVTLEGGRAEADEMKRVRLYALDADTVAQMSDYADRLGRQVRDDQQRKELAAKIRADYPVKVDDDEEQIRVWSDGNLSVFFAMRAERERQREVELSAQPLYLSLRDIVGGDWEHSSAGVYDRRARYELS